MNRAEFCAAAAFLFHSPMTPAARVFCAGELMWETAAKRLVEQLERLSKGARPAWPGPHSHCFFFASSVFANSAAKVTTARRSWGFLILKNARTSWIPSSGSAEEVVALLASDTLPDGRLAD